MSESIANQLIDHALLRNYTIQVGREGVELLERALEQEFINSQNEENMVTGEIEQDVHPVVRRTRQRRPREIPPFKLIKPTEGIEKIKVQQIVVPSTTTFGNLFMCPYTNYIPIDYLLVAHQSSSLNYSVSSKNISPVIRGE